MKIQLSAIVIFILFSNFLQAQTVTQKDSSHCIVAHAAMSVDEFNTLLNTEKYVLVDFYADWCAPCRMLAPVIEQIAKEDADKVIVVRVNQDNNKPLFDALHVYELPTLLLYKNKEVKNTFEGFFPKEMIEAEFK
jgi:thioredoxin